VGTGVIRDVEFMAWGRLFSIPILRRIIRFFGAFPVEITKVDKSAYIEAIKALNNGKALIMFPEGGRSVDVYYHEPITIDKHEFADIKARNEFLEKVTNKIIETIKNKLEAEKGK
jgi:1-acyl-sn-glycerol-3-phosphate acyltransferase